MRTWIVWAALAAGLLLVPAGAGAEVPEGADYFQDRIRSSDGTSLHVDVLRPKGVERAPVLLVVSPYNAHGPSERGAPGMAYGAVRRLAPMRRGYNVVIVSLRGSGGSEGCFDFYGPGEQADVAAAVRYAATRTWSTGQVVALGGSYDGGTAMLAMALGDPAVVAAAVYQPVVSPYRTMFAGGVPYWINPTVNAYYPAIAVTGSGAADDDVSYHSAWAKRTGCVPPVWTAETDPAASFWAARSFEERVLRSRVPVFGVQGFLDFNLAPDNLPFVYPALEGRGLWLTQAGHEQPAADGFWSQVGRFVDGAVGDGPPQQGVTVQEAPTLRWRKEAAWPPADRAGFSIPLRAGAYTDQRGNGSGDSPWEPGLGSFPGEELPEGRGSWTFTQPLSDEVHLAGFGSVRAHVTGPASARAVALLYDVRPDGTALLIARGAQLLGEGTIDIRLQPQDWRVAKGHRIGLLMSGSDDTWFAPVPGTQATVTVAGGTLELPVLRGRRDRFIAGEPGARFDMVKEPIEIERSTIESATVRAKPPKRRRPRARRR